MGGPRIPKWESRLWTLVSNNDGVHCLMRDHCRTCKRGGLCCENLFKFRHLFVSDVVDHTLFDTVRPEGPAACVDCWKGWLIETRYTRQYLTDILPYHMGAY